MNSRSIKIKGVRGFGNFVSHSERKTRRSFKINKVKSLLYSEVLKQKIHIHAPAYQLRNIMKYGNIDQYLIHGKVTKELLGLRKDLVTRLKITTTKTA